MGHHIIRDFPLFKNKVSAILTIALIMVSFVSLYEYQMINNRNVHDSFGIKGSFSLYRDGKLVVQQDQLTYVSYATVICKLFNDTTACTNAGNSWDTGGGNSIGTICKSGSGATPPSTFYASSYCTFLGVALSTDTATPVIGGVCGSYITTNGMAPVKATTLFLSNTQSITLTVSWTASGSQSFDKACLIAWQTVHVLGLNINTYYSYDPAFAEPFAIQLFATQSVTNGQTWTAQWTFSF